MTAFESLERKGESGLLCVSEVNMLSNNKDSTVLWLPSIFVCKFVSKMVSKTPYSGETGHRIDLSELILCSQDNAAGCFNVYSYFLSVCFHLDFFLLLLFYLYMFSF